MPLPVAATADSEPSSLPLAELQSLIEGGRVHPTPASPLGFLLLGRRSRNATDRAARVREGWHAGNRELASALRIVSRPEARIRVTTRSRTAKPRQLILWRALSLVAPAGFDATGVQLGAPMRVSELQSLLVDKLRSAAPTRGAPDLLIAPGALGLLTSLWPRGGHQVDEALSIEEALFACQSLGAEGTADQKWVDALSESGLVVRNGSSLAMAQDLQPWLERYWSGDVTEIEVVSLPEGDFDASRLSERRERLLFVGPQGKRLAARFVEEASLVDLPAGVLRSDDLGKGALGAGVVLSYLGDGFLEQTIGTLLRLAPAGPPSLADAPPPGADREC